MRWGIPDMYAAIDWARAYREFLEDWATLVRALSRFAYKVTTKGRNVAGAKTRLSTGVGSPDGSPTETNPPPPAGSTFVQSPGTSLEAVGKTGATVAATDGKQLRLMVAAAVDFPDTILSGDADQGNLATAKTLDRPTELAMLERQQLGRDILTDVATWIIAAAVRAGVLSGEVFTDDDDIRVLVDGEPLKVVVEFPDILDPDVQAEIDALVKLATLDGKADANMVPPDALRRRGMKVLGFEDVDELVGELEAIADRSGEEDVAEVLAEVRDAARAIIAAA
jgi:hypothetical protein